MKMVDGYNIVNDDSPFINSDVNPENWGWSAYDETTDSPAAGLQVSSYYDDGTYHFTVAVEDRGGDWDYNDLVLSGTYNPLTGEMNLVGSGEAADTNILYLDGKYIYSNTEGAKVFSMRYGDGIYYLE